MLIKFGAFLDSEYCQRAFRTESDVHMKEMLVFNISPSCAKGTLNKPKYVEKIIYLSLELG